MRPGSGGAPQHRSRAPFLTPLAVQQIQQRRMLALGGTLDRELDLTIRQTARDAAILTGGASRASVRLTDLVPGTRRGGSGESSCTPPAWFSYDRSTWRARSVDSAAAATPVRRSRHARLSWVGRAARDRLSPHDPTVEQQPRPPDLRRSGSYSVPFASAWRKRGEIVESERLHVSSPALPSDRAEVSPNLRVLMFASAAGGDALKQDDTGHWGRGGVE